jgi:hypothetical protein
MAPPASLDALKSRKEKSVTLSGIELCFFGCPFLGLANIPTETSCVCRGSNQDVEALLILYIFRLTDKHKIFHNHQTAISMNRKHFYMFRLLYLTTFKEYTLYRFVVCR